MVKITRKLEPLTTNVETDVFTQAASQAFDYEFSGSTEFYPYALPELPKEFSIGLICGASGTGKSLLLKDLPYQNPDIFWYKEKAVVSHFENPDDAIDRLASVGLNSIPAWVKPFHCLSNGQQFRANLARIINSESKIDEFTSVVDRNVAKSASVAISKFITRRGFQNIVFATCHYDIIEWLQPDWVIDTSEGIFYTEIPKRPEIEFEIVPAERSKWSKFAEHHYLSSKLNNSSRCFSGYWNGIEVAFTAVLPFPSGTIKNGWREHRTVVLPDFQGLGIGAKFSDAIAQMMIDEGKKYYSRTAHYRLGEYRDRSPLWRATGKSRKKRNDIKNYQNRGKEEYHNWKTDGDRVCYSHEYIGYKDS